MEGLSIVRNHCDTIYFLPNIHKRCANILLVIHYSTTVNHLEWHFYLKTFFQENALGNFVWKVSTFLCQIQGVDSVYVWVFAWGQSMLLNYSTMSVKEWVSSNLKSLETQLYVEKLSQINSELMEFSPCWSSGLPLHKWPVMWKVISWCHHEKKEFRPCSSLNRKQASLSVFSVFMALPIAVWARLMYSATGRLIVGAAETGTNLHGQKGNGSKDTIEIVWQWLYWVIPFQNKF